MPRLGLLGPPNSGKSTLFNALTGLDAATAAHPFTTIEPQPGVAEVKDDKLLQVGRLEGSAKVVPATIELVDLPSWRPGGGSQVLATLREMDGLVAVLGSFERGTDPAEQAEELSLELVFADHEVFEKRNQRLQKEATAEPRLRSAAEAVARAVGELDAGKALRLVDWSAEELKALRDSAPLTLKPFIWVVNHAEDAADVERLTAVVAACVVAGDVVVGMAARLEEEARHLDEASRVEAYLALGLGSGALVRMVEAAYRALGLISFYTVGPKEARAWTVVAGANAAQAAGRIHSDLERGFIRAEVAHIDAVLAAGGWEAAKKRGTVRLEGRNYVVGKGDVLHVRFSV